MGGPLWTGKCPQVLGQRDALLSKAIEPDSDDSNVHSQHSPCATIHLHQASYRVLQINIAGTLVGESGDIRRRTTDWNWNRCAGAIPSGGH
jgi:hypothetical protein